MFCLPRFLSTLRADTTELQKALESVILNPRYADYLAVVKAARNGAVYGAKVRFPHALV